LSLARPLKWPPIFPLEKGLVLWLLFDDRSGSEALDRSGKLNRGTLYGPTWVAGKIGSALSFDGVNNSMQVADSTSLRLTSALTIAAWIYPKSAGELAYGRIVSKRDSANYAFSMGGGTSVFVYLDATAYASTGTGRVPYNVWSFVAVTFDKTLPSNQVKTYVNGVLKGTGTRTTDIPTSTYPLIIGNRLALDRCFDGTIDEVRIYNRALTAAEIKRHYESEIFLGRVGG